MKDTIETRKWMTGWGPVLTVLAAMVGVSLIAAWEIFRCLNGGGCHTIFPG